MNEEYPKLILTEGERQSAVWHKLKQYIHARLDMHRRTNDDISSVMSEARTQRLRGRIAECKDLLSLDQSDKG